MKGSIYRRLINMPYYAWHDPTYPFEIPAINWEVMSHEQRVQWLTCNIAGLIKYANEMADNVNLLDADIDKLSSDFEKFKESGFEDYYEDQIAAWIDAHAAFLFERFAKQVFFGLTYDPDDARNSGYFCIYVPESWSDITFDTGMTYGEFDYGRLILRFTADGSGVIDNTGRYDDTDINVLRADVERLKRTLYTVLNQGGE